MTAGLAVFRILRIRSGAGSPLPRPGRRCIQTRLKLEAFREEKFKRWRVQYAAWMVCHALRFSRSHATPALPHGLSRDFALAGTPAMLWNIVQFPAGVVPVTRVRAAEAARPGASDRLEKQAAEVDRRSTGLPVGVQVVARPWEEDTLLAAMIAIEEGVSQSADFPRAPVG